MNMVDQLQLRLVFWGLVCWTVASPARYEDPDPACYDSRSGLPACNFNFGNCFHEGAGITPAWKIAKQTDPGPVEPYEGAYVFLDSKESKDEPRTMKASMAAGKKAICVEFYYATSGNATVPINIYMEDGGQLSLIHRVEANTGGAWKSTQFSCCLPQAQTVKKIAVEGQSTDDAVVALDDLDIRVSTMPCENGQLACYPAPPSQAPLEPMTSSPTCPSDDHLERDGPSCDFTMNARNVLGTCGWQLSSGWTARQKIDGSGHYNTLYSTVDRGAYLLSYLSYDAGSFCVEIQFRTENITANPSNVFFISIQDENNSTLFSDEAYNYEGSTSTVWKRNTFSACLPERHTWQILITSNIKGLQFDYIHTATSQSVCESATARVAETSQPSSGWLGSTSTPAPRENTEDFLTAAGERRPGAVRSGVRSGGRSGAPWRNSLILSIILLLVLVQLAALGAVAWECMKRHQAEMPLRFNPFN